LRPFQEPHFLIVAVLVPDIRSVQLRDLINITIVEPYTTKTALRIGICGPGEGRRKLEQKETTTMNNNYPLNIGALFKNENSQSTKAPVLTGTIDLDRALVTHLFRLIESGKRARISLGGWKNVSKTGKAYFTIKASPEYKPQDTELPIDEDDDGLDL
jgi:hypothetical protein